MSPQSQEHDVKKKVRFLFFGKKAWDSRAKLAGSFIRECEMEGAHVQVRSVVTKRDASNALRAVKATRDDGSWSNLCYGNIDLKMAKPICDILWPPRTESPGNVLDFSMPVSVNAYMTKVVRVRG